MNHFQGFPSRAFSFLEELSRRQDRDWFRAHKDDYVALWQRPMESLLETLAGQLSRTYPGVNEAPWKMFRIYTDTRFAPKKDPFKNHVAGKLPLGPEGEGSVLYIHLGLDESIVAAGRWMMEPEQLSRLRDAIARDDTGAPFARAVQGAVKKGFQLYSFEQLKRVPSPYPKDHPRADLLKRKGLSFGFPSFKPSEAASPQFASWIVKQAKAIAPVVLQMDAFTSSGAGPPSRLMRLPVTRGASE
jgi:uncharacterized protein (TIGR02453 family)